MIRKILLYGLGAAICVAFVCSTQWGEMRFSTGSLQAEVDDGSKDAAEDVVFLTDYAAAKQAAIEENKPALLFFMSKNCKHSRAMAEGAFQDGEVKRLSQQFVCAEIDLSDPKNDELRDSFNVASSPTVQFTAANGAPLQRLSGEQSGERLSEQMRAVLTSVAWRAANLERRDLFF